MPQSPRPLSLSSADPLRFWSFPFSQTPLLVPGSPLSAQTRLPGLRESWGWSDFALLQRWLTALDPQARQDIVAVKLHSPLLIRLWAKKYNFKNKSPLAIKKRSTTRFKKEVVRRRRMSAQVLSPGAIIEPEPQVEAPQEWRRNLSVRIMCPECREDPPNLIEDSQAGDTICESCGIVLAQRGIDLRAEWRTFANDDQGNDDPSRVGDAPNLLLNGSQLQTNIAYNDGSLRSKELQRAQSRSTADKGNKNLLQAFKQIGAYCDSYQLTQVIADGAKHIYKDAEESKLFKGKSQEALIAGCIFLSCRRNGVPRSFREIFEMTQVSKKDIGRTFKLLEKFLMNQEKSQGGKATVIANGKSLSCCVGVWDWINVASKVSLASTTRTKPRRRRTRRSCACVSAAPWGSTSDAPTLPLTWPAKCRALELWPGARLCRVQRPASTWRVT